MSEHKKFEYRIAYLSLGGVEQKLNAFGEEGWELVAIDTDNETSRMYVFKREKRNET